jgi:hypothetical protein
MGCITQHQIEGTFILEWFLTRAIRELFFQGTMTRSKKQMRIKEPSSNPTYVTAYRKREKGSKTITVYDTTPEEAIALIERAAKASSSSRRRTSQRTSVSA